MRFSIHFAADLLGLPSGVRVAIADAMESVARAVAEIPASSPFWGSMRESVLQLVTAGWRVGYRIEPETGRIDVVYATPAASAQQRG